MSIFQTTADTNFNSFSNPWNPVNANGGGAGYGGGQWGIDPAYLTPSYAAPYRPQYAGPQGAPPPDYHTGFFRSAFNLFTPFGPSYPYGDTVNQEDPYYSSLAYRPVDAGMWAAHRGILPAMAFAAGMKASSAQVANANPAMRAALSSIYRITGHSAAETATKASTVGFGWASGDAVGRQLAAGFSRGIGAGTSSVGASAFIRGAGMMGGLAGSLAMPLAIGQGVMNVAEATMIDPYQATALTERSLRSNFSNVMGGSIDQRGRVTGFGMSRGFAGRLANNLTQDSIKDMTFDTYQMGELTDYAARSGMLDNAQFGQIEGRMKTIAKQVKMMMRVANEPDFKSAMEMLAELKVGGVSESVANRVMGNLGNSAAIGGISVQKLMNTVGAQGQYLFQANGLTPYIGQTAAGQSYGAFASAYRMGLLDPATLAKFGGLEGITQLSLTGQVNAAQTPYNQIMMMNKYLGNGSNKGGVIGNVSRFAHSAAMDPMGAAGAMGYYAHDMMSRQLMEDGTNGFINQIQDIAGYLPGMKNKDGTVDVEKAYLIATRQMDIGDEQSRALLKEIYTNHDPATAAMRDSARSGNTIRDTMKALEQEGLGFGGLNKPIYGIRSSWKGIKAEVGGAVGGMRTSAGEVGDDLQEWYTGIRFGTLVKNKEADTLGEMLGEGEGSKSFELRRGVGQALTQKWGRAVDLSPPGLFAHHVMGINPLDKAMNSVGLDPFFNTADAFDKINKAAQEGNKDAKALLDPNNRTGKAIIDALDNLNVGKKLGLVYSPEDLKRLEAALGNANLKETTQHYTGSAGAMEKGLRKGLGLSGNETMLDSLGILESSYNIIQGKGSDDDFASLRKVYGDKLKTELRDIAEKNLKNSTKEGVVHLSGALTSHSLDEIRKGAESGDIALFGSYGKEVKDRISKIKADPKLSPEEKRRQIDQITSLGLIKNTGTSTKALIDKDSTPDSVSAESLVSILSQSRVSAVQAQKDHYASTRTGINFDTSYSKDAAANLSKPVAEFADHVKAFGEIVEKMGNDQGVTNAEGFWKSFNPFSSNEKKH